MIERTVSLDVNGIARRAVVEPRTSLGDFLRDGLRLTGLHLACEHGVCGACNVYVQGQLSRSCTVLAVACEDLAVQTIEAFDDDPLMEQLRLAFSQAHALQCGYCTPGMLMSARDIVVRFPDADEAAVRRELAGNLCRCTGYAGIVRAILQVIRSGAGHRPAAPVQPPAQAHGIPVTAFAGSAGSGARPDLPPAVPATPAPASLPAPAPVPADTAGMTRVSRRFELATPVDQAWAFFSDLPRVAACMPGMSVEEADADRMAGKMTVKAGPIRAVFDAQAHVERDAAGRRGTVHCRGVDRITRTGVVCQFDYALQAAAPDAAGATAVRVDAAFRLDGRLAQFSRTDIVQALADQLTTQFAANVARQLEAPAGTPGPGPAGGGELRLPVAMLLRQYASALAARAMRALRGRHTPDAPHRPSQPHHEDDL